MDGDTDRSADGDTDRSADGNTDRNADGNTDGDTDRNADEATGGITVRRVYDAPAPGDGTRVLVDRLWPRGVSKERAAVDEWLKEVAPSNELRTWYHKDASRHVEFDARYRQELAQGPAADALDRLLALARGGPVTLVTSVKSIEGSHLQTLVDVLRQAGGTGQTSP